MFNKNTISLLQLIPSDSGAYLTSITPFACSMYSNQISTLYCPPAKYTSDFTKFLARLNTIASNTNNTVGTIYYPCDPDDAGNWMQLGESLSTRFKPNATMTYHTSIYWDVTDGESTPYTF